MISMTVSTSNSRLPTCRARGTRLGVHALPMIVFAGASTLFACLALSCDKLSTVWVKDPASSNALFKVGDAWGGGMFIDTSGKVALRIKKGEVALNDFHDGVMVVDTSNGSGYLNSDGTWAVRPQYHRAQDFSEGLAPVRDTAPKFWGYIDKSGVTAIPKQFDNCGRFRSGLAPATLDGKTWGYIGHDGKFAIPPRFLYAAEFSENRARVVQNGTQCRMRVRDSCDSWEILPPTIRPNSGPAPEFCHVKFVNKSGNLITQEGFDYAADFSEGFAAVILNGRWGFIDEQGRWAISPQFDDAGPFSGGLAAAKTKGEWGYIDKTGRFVIEPNFWTASPFTEGVAAVGFHKGYRYIDNRGKFAMSDAFDFATPFALGLAHVVSHDINGQFEMYVNHEGHSVFSYPRAK